MDDLQQYINRAMELREFKSIRQLSIALGKSPGVISQYQRGLALPDDPTMVKLATFADIDHAKALLDLNSWRVKDPDVKRIYKKLAKTMATAALLTTMSLPPGGSNANAEQIGHRSTLSVAISVYYGVFRRWWRNRRRANDLVRLA